MHDTSQPEVRHLRATTLQKQVLRLDVPMLNVGRVEVVDSRRGPPHVLEQVGHRQSATALRPLSLEQVVEALVSQLGHHNEPGPRLPNAEESEQVGVPHIAERYKRLNLGT
jgi:hypothetical protein